MKFLKSLSEFFSAKPQPKNSPDRKPARRHVKDIKPGESIQIEWYRIKGGIGNLKCINNDPQTKKILLQVTWGNYQECGHPEKEKIILDYDSKELANFHLLNQAVEQAGPTDDDCDIAMLQKKMNEAMEKEEYEKASELQKKIDKLLKS